MIGHRHLIAIVLAFAPVLAIALSAIAQEASPVVPWVVDRLDLAAMALEASDLPDGYRQERFDDEGYTPGHRIAAIQTGGTISQAAVTATGVTWYYSSTFRHPNGTDWVLSYLSEFPNADAVTAGFALFEDEERLASHDEEHRDGPGLSAGEAPKESTFGAYPDPATPARRVRYIDATFRVGRVLAGVVVTESRVGEASSPDPVLVEALASTLVKRIEAVLARQVRSGIDLRLPTQMLPLFATWSWPGNSLEGHKSAEEFLGWVRKPAAFAPHYRAGYAVFASVGSAPGGMVHDPPYVDVAVAEFATTEAAAGVLATAEALLQRHFGRTVARDEVAAPTVPGVESARAFHSDRPATGGPESLHLMGYEVVVVQGTTLVVVSVQVDADDLRASLAQAEAAALDLAGQQVACLGSDAPCGVVQVPAAFVAGPDLAATPVSWTRGMLGDTHRTVSHLRGVVWRSGR